MVLIRLEQKAMLVFSIVFCHILALMSWKRILLGVLEYWSTGVMGWTDPKSV